MPRPIIGDRARTHVQEARAIFDALRVPTYVHRAEHLAAQLASRRSDGPPAEPGPCLSPPGTAGGAGDGSRDQPRGSRIARVAGVQCDGRLGTSPSAGSARLEDTETEGLPDGAILRGLRHPAIAQSPTFDRQNPSRRGQRPSMGPPPIHNHRDARIGFEALAELSAELSSIPADHDEPGVELVPTGPDAVMAHCPAGKGPGVGARMTFVDPLVITFLAVVVVVHGRRRGWSAPCRGFQESFPEHIPVPRDTA